MNNLIQQILEWFRPIGKKTNGRPLKRRRRPAYLRKRKRRPSSSSGNDWIPFVGDGGLVPSGDDFGGGSSAGGGASGEW